MRPAQRNALREHLATRSSARIEELCMSIVAAQQGAAAVGGRGQGLGRSDRQEARRPPLTGGARSATGVGPK